jgi:carbon starvation protein CstA
MKTFLAAVLLLVVGYFWYGRLLERTFGVSPERPVPANTLNDGIDFLPMGWCRAFLIQLLNIAGLGPVFGAVLGALWGPVAFLWIVFGGLFIGGVHDFIAGYMSLRHDGANLPTLIGTYLGGRVRKAMVALTLVLLMVVGVLFVMGPARILADIGLSLQATPPGTGSASEAALTPVPWYGNMTFWIIIVFIYYFLATLLPIDQIIGRVYPVFGAGLLLMVLLISFQILSGRLPIPELTLLNLHPRGTPIWPIMMVTIACGAVSGFHATQAPMIARTLTSEKVACRVFYGSMLAETFIALVWAAAAMGFCHGSTQELMQKLGPKSEAVLVVKGIAMNLGPTGLLLALLGVVALPITTGDTAFRAARLILAEGLGFEQKSIKNRLLICIPMFILGVLMCRLSFGLLWQYLSWLNQALAAVTLWAATVYLHKNGRNWLLTGIPALFMTAVAFCYILIEGNIGFGMAQTPANFIGGTLAMIAFALVLFRKKPAISSPGLS